MRTESKLREPYRSMYRNHFHYRFNDVPNSKFSNIFTIRRWAIKRLMFLSIIIGTFFPSGLLIAQDGIVNTFTGLSNSAYSRNSKRIVNIVALQAGNKHYQKGNPGLEANFALFAELARQAAASKPLPDLICFPEYAIAGWGYPPEKIINSLAESIPGDGSWYLRYRDLAREVGIPILCWLVESENNKLYNTAFILDGKDEFKGKYRKVHANLGEQTWWGWSQGERFELIELDSVRYGVSICADMWFPETVRCYELLGADIVLHQSIGDDMGHIIPVRAFDSKVPIVAAIFRGGSYAVDGEGKLLGKLSVEEAGWKSFQIYPFTKYYGKKYGGIWDIKKGQHNVRNVDAYSILTDPSTRPPWTEIFMNDAGEPQTREQLLKRFHGRYDANDPGTSRLKLTGSTRRDSSVTELGINGTKFTVNGSPAFLYGISYYGALGAPEDFIRRDLSDMKKYGFNWIRVWAIWSDFDYDVSAVDSIGNPREPFFTKLKWLVRECDRKGIIVDVTLTRGKYGTGTGLQTLNSHRQALVTIINLLKPYHNWYIDLANERNEPGRRFVSFDELKQLRETAKQIDSRLLITASAGGNTGISYDDLHEYLMTAQVDFISPHTPRRNAEGPGKTESNSLEYLTWIKDLGCIVPVHFQEPFRRGYNNWQPTVEDYITALRGARAGGAGRLVFS